MTLLPLPYVKSCSDENSRMCRRCAEVRPIEKFTAYYTCKDGSSSRKWVCNRCRSKLPGNVRYAKKAQAEGLDVLRQSVRRMERRKIAEGQSCQVCDSDERVVVDHRWGDDFARGFLCSRCNIGIGFFKDSPERLVAASEYLLKRR